jgi:hypothetical protein
MSDVSNDAGPPSGTRPSSGSRRTRRLVWSAIAAAATLVGLAGGLLGLVTGTISLREKLQPTPAPYQFTDGDLARDGNQRFGFTFAYPKSWTRTDPANADGNTYTAPTMGPTPAKFFVYGSNRAAGLDELSFVRERSRGKIIQQRDAGTHIWSFCDQNGQQTETQEQIPGKLAQYEYFDQQSKRTTTGLIEFAELQDRVIAAVGEAPSSGYPAYDNLFRRLLAEVHPLKTLSGVAC